MVSLQGTASRRIGCYHAKLAQTEVRGTMDPIKTFQIFFTTQNLVVLSYIPPRRKLGPVCGSEIACIDLHQIGSVSKGSDHRRKLGPASFEDDRTANLRVGCSIILKTCCYHRCVTMTKFYSNGEDGVSVRRLSPRTCDSPALFMKCSRLPKIFKLPR